MPVASRSSLALSALLCVAAVAMGTAVARPLAAQGTAAVEPATWTVPVPVLLDTAGRFRDRVARVGDDLFIAGQPTERGLRELRAQGVTTIVNLRSPEEMARIGFDEAALAKSLGMAYVWLPMRGTPELPYTPAAVKSLAAAINGAPGKVLLHCTIAWRASHLWAAYLVTERGVPVDTALARARAINLMDDMHHFGPQEPVEAFLARVVPELKLRQAAP